MEYHVLALSPTRGGFFDPESRINLTLLNPQAVFPVGSPITGAMKTALRSGGIIDVKGTIHAELTEEGQPVPAEPFRPESMEDADKGEEPPVQEIAPEETTEKKEETPKSKAKSKAKAPAKKE